MQTRVVAAIEQRLTVSLVVAARVIRQLKDDH
jgi:hypothetical protein